MGLLFNLITILFLVLMNGFFVASEFSIVKVRGTRIETLILEGNQRAKKVKKIIDNLNSYLSACQLGITLASLGLGWLGEPYLSKIVSPILKFFKLPEVAVHSISLTAAFVLITWSHIVLGELVPKSLAIISAEKIVMATSTPLTAFYKLTYPIIWLFNATSNLILKAIGIEQSDEHESAHTDEEIRILVEESYEHGLIDKTELTFVDNIFEFSETHVREIMVPRTDMICFYKDDPIDDIIKTALEEQLTRYPVCGEDKDDIIGFIHIKDLFKLGVEKSTNLEGIIRDVLKVPESMSISVLLKKFQISKEQMAIVFDEYGGTAGLVTVEDILEEIVGEIQDEFDEDNLEEIKALENSSYSIDGKTQIDEVNELLKTDIPSEDFDTIGGWLYSKIDSTPQINQKTTHGNYEFMISSLDNLRITRVIVKPLPNTSIDEEISEDIRTNA